MNTPFLLLNKVNFYIVLYSSSQGKWKIADLGITKEGSTETSRETFKALCSAGYCAPEFITAPYPPKYTNRVDIWALGCIVHELSTAQKTFENNFDIETFARHNVPFQRVRFPFAGPSAELLFPLIERMLALEPRKRPSPTEIVTSLHNRVFNDPMLLTPMAYHMDDNLDWLIDENGKILIKNRLAYSYGASSSQVHEVKAFCFVV